MYVVQYVVGPIGYIFISAGSSNFVTFPIKSFNKACFIF